MSANKKPFVVSKRHFTFVGGIAICLFSVVLIINVGYFARALALPFTYGFGLISYVFYILVYFYGLSLFFREKAIKIRFNNYFFGTILLILAATMIATLVITNDAMVDGNIVKISYKDDIANNVYSFKTFYNKHVFEAIDGYNSPSAYWKSSFINLFQKNKFGGGFIGYAIVGFLNGTITKAGTWAVSIFIALAGLFVIFFPTFRKLFLKNKKAKASKPEKEREVEKATVTRIENINSIASASKLENERPMTEVQERPQPLNSQPINFVNRNEPVPSSSMSGNYGSSSSFVPARFAKYQSKILVENEKEAEPVKEPISGQQALLESNKEVIRSEQMQLNFNEKPTLNEQLVSAKPEFVEPVNVTPNRGPFEQVHQDIQSAPQVVPQPAVQEVVRKPIKWVPPSTDLLETMEVGEAIDENNRVAEERMAAINEVFESFNVGAFCNSYVVGPAVTRYNIEYRSNVSVKNVDRLVDDISVRLGGVSARFESVVEGQRYSGLEVPNARITAVPFKEVYEALPDVKKHPLAVAFGKSIENKFVIADFDEFPHILVAGTTGSGKSVFTQSLICTLIMRNSPEDLKLVLVDPKKVEMNKYRDTPHLLCPIINDANTAKLTLSKLVDEMNRRYELLDEAYCSNIKSYNRDAEENGKEKLPYIIVFIDEYADLVDVCKDISQPVVSLAQKARAAGIHMLIATQRPSTNVITGVIKGNLPTRVALAVAMQVDSVTILGSGGAEKLLGRGDMLVQSPLVSRTGVSRLQACYIQDKEIKHIAGYLKQHYECFYDPNFTNLVDASAQAAGDVIGSPEFQGSLDNSEEAKYQEVKAWVMSNNYMSMSRIQRDCSVGFNRAGRFFKRLQDEGIVATETEGNKGCPVLVHDQFYEGSPASDIPTSIDQTEF